MFSGLNLEMARVILLVISIAKGDCRSMMTFLDE
jgi:hypothetical protein